MTTLGQQEFPKASLYRRSLALVLAVATAVVFFAAGWMTRYSMSPPQAAGPVVVVERQAFSPFDLRLGELRELSPRGIRPLEVSPQESPQRALRFYNRGRAAATNDKITDESVYWFKQSARLCEATSLYALGVAYWKGEGVPQPERVMGYQLLRIATAMGQPQAKEFIRTLRPESE